MSKKSTGSKLSYSLEDDELETIQGLGFAYKNKRVRKSQKFLDLLEKFGKDKLREIIKDLGIRTPGSDWTLEEDELLRMDGAATSRQFIREKLPHRTFRAVCIHLQELGITGGEGLVAPQGFIFLAEAVRITGIDYRALRDIAKERGVLFRRIIGRLKCPKAMRYYVDEEEIVAAVKSHLEELNILITTNEIMAEFPSISQTIFRRAVRKSGIEVKTKVGVITRFTPDQADKVRKQIAIRLKELEEFNQKAKVTKDAADLKKETMDIPRGFIPIAKAIAEFDVSEEEIALEIKSCYKMAVTIRGETYVGRKKIKKIWENKHVTVPMLMKEFKVSYQVVYRCFDRLGISTPGVHGKKVFLTMQEAEKVRSILAHRQVMLDSKSGTKVDA